MLPTWLAPALLLVGLGGATSGCGETAKNSYQIEIQGPREHLAGAANVTMIIGNKEVARATTMGNGAFTLETQDLDPAVTKMAIIAIRVTDAGGQLLAFGQTPELEFQNDSRSIAIFVQKPGTLAPGRPLPLAIKDQVGVTAHSQPAAGSQLRVTMPLFGFGRERRLTGTTFGNEQLSNEMFVYNPFRHRAEGLPPIGDSLRAEAAALAHPNGQIYLFGGVAQANTIGVTSRLEVFELLRSSTTIDRTEVRPYLLEPAARRQAVLAAAEHLVVAFGGLGDAPSPALDTAVIMYPGSATPLSIPAERMSAPRHGHTASSVKSPTSMVLVYGGAPPGGSVADLFNPLASPPAFVPFAARPEQVPPAAGATVSPGTGRRDHLALEIATGASADKKVLIFGGVDDAGQPRGDSILFDPGTLSFSAGPLTLRTPRSHFAAFTIDKDLVIVGGRGADGKPIATAEVYDLSSLADGPLTMVAELPAVPRTRAVVGAMSNLSVAIIGGEGPDGSSNAVEIYQPRR